MLMFCYRKVFPNDVVDEPTDMASREKLAKLLAAKAATTE